MRYMLFILLLVSFGCASKPRQPATAGEATPVTPATGGSSETMDLDAALQKGPGPTLEFLKAQSKAKSFDGLDSADPAANLPRSLKPERSSQLNKEKSFQQAFLRKFKAWNLPKKLNRGQELLADFDCGKATESQALGFSLEIDFPDQDAGKTSQALHEKILVCEAFNRQESLFRLAIFSIQKGECPRALGYLDKFPATPERGINDRLAYLRSLCSTTAEVDTRNPWGGYGILLADTKKKSEQETLHWQLSASSGDEEWDRLLASYIELTQSGHADTVQYLSSKVNYEKFRTLPLAFQTSVMVLMSFCGADLSVFQTLHRYLSEHPENLSPAVSGLLFPTRYWKEIVENSKSVDPILVKSLIRQESAFNPAARSRARATGLMQLIYPTARVFGVRNVKQLLSPDVNILAGSQFLSQLINKFGSVELALAAYNAGPNIVEQWIRRYPTGNVDLFVEMIPYSETREYVRLVKRNYKVYQSILGKPQVIGDLKH
jgi:hypothetical protein